MQTDMWKWHCSFYADLSICIPMPMFPWNNNEPTETMSKSRSGVCSHVFIRGNLFFCFAAGSDARPRRRGRNGVAARKQAARQKEQEAKGMCSLCHRSSLHVLVFSPEQGQLSERAATPPPTPPPWHSDDGLFVVIKIITWCILFCFLHRHSCWQDVQGRTEFISCGRHRTQRFVCCH